MTPTTATAAEASPLLRGSKPSQLRAFVTDIRDLARFARETVYYVFAGKREPGAVAKQMFAVGNQSLFFLCSTMGFLGVILVFQSGMQAVRVVPDYNALGPFYIKLLVRDLAASIGAMPLATRVGAGIAAEIGTMVVTDQTDALRMCAADPIDYLVVPRFIACLVMCTVLIVIAGFIALLTGMITANVVFDVNYVTFLNMHMVTTGDVITGLLKCVAYGAAIPIVAAKRGLEAFGGSAGVGRSTTNAVVHSTVAIILLNFVISGVCFVLFPE